MMIEKVFLCIRKRLAQARMLRVDELQDSGDPDLDNPSSRLAIKLVSGRDSNRFNKTVSLRTPGIRILSIDRANGFRLIKILKAKGKLGTLSNFVKP